MHPQKDLHTESALYWSAVSLIVCEGLSVGAAAQRLGIENGRLRNILRRRRLASVTETRHVGVGPKADLQPDARRT
jgi:DNA-directed RNA polymerase specialized sigma24 family protein